LFDAGASWKYTMDKRSSTPKVVTKKHIARLEREQRQIRLIRGFAIGGLVLVAALLIIGYLQLNVFAKQQPVAVVNGDNITTGQFQERVRLQRVSLYNQLNQYQYFQQAFGMDTTQQQQSIQAQLNSTETIGDGVLNTMIDDVLLRQQAQERGITISKEEVDQYIQEAYGFYKDGTPVPTIAPTEFAYPTLSAEQLKLYPPTMTPTIAPTFTPEPTSTLDPSVTATATVPPFSTPTSVPELPTASPTSYTLEGFQGEFQKTLEEFKGYGISEQALRSLYEVQVLRKKLMEDQEKDVTATETQVLARHILVDTIAEATAVEELLKQGIDFGELARKYSKDTGSGANGGDLGWSPASNYVPEFADAVSTLEIGQVSEPVKTQFGYHIIQVIAREELPLSADQIEQKKQTAFDEWLQSVHDSAEITINDIWRTRVPTEPVLTQGQ
jgi:parvulin-like peptidyl-prolyl isomerase